METRSEARYMEGYGDPRRITVDDWIFVVAFVGAWLVVLILWLL